MVVAEEPGDGEHDTRLIAAMRLAFEAALNARTPVAICRSCRSSRPASAATFGASPEVTYWSGRADEARGRSGVGHHAEE